MKLERLPEFVLPFVVTLLGMGMAVAMGYLMGQGRISTVLLVLVGLCLGFITLTLRQHVWLIVPLGWPLTGTIPLLPVPLAVRDLAVGAVVCSYAMLIALKVIRVKPKYEWVDYALLVMLLYLVTVFLRNPVGTLASGSPRIGGKPYFNIAIACLAYWILSRSTITRGTANAPIFATLAGNYFAGFLNLVALIFPRSLPVLANVYSDIQALENNNTPGVVARDAEQSRFGFLLSFGISSIQALLAFFRPLTLINPIYVLRCVGFGLAVLCLLLSGFRSSIIATAIFILLAATLRDGLGGFLRLSATGLVALTIIVAGNGRIYNLPFAAQRALCFLPGNWDPQAVADASRSTDWRIEMWKEYIGTNRYIQNRLLGDGFGFLKRDMDLLGMASSAGGADSQEGMMLVGNVHSGPIHAIRIAGYLGLVLYLVVLCSAATYAWRTINRAKGTYLAALTLFIGLPTIYEAFSYVFIYGALDWSLQGTLYSVGLLKVVNRGLDAENDDQLTSVGNRAQPVPVEARELAHY